MLRLALSQKEISVEDVVRLPRACAEYKERKDAFGLTVADGDDVFGSPTQLIQDLRHGVVTETPRLSETERQDFDNISAQMIPRVEALRLRVGVNDVAANFFKRAHSPNQLEQIRMRRRIERPVIERIGFGSI